jgi:hypothetical protein
MIVDLRPDSVSTDSQTPDRPVFFRTSPAGIINLFVEKVTEKYNTIKSMTLPRIFITKGGSEFEAYPLPSITLGSSSLCASFSSAT